MSSSCLGGWAHEQDSISYNKNGYKSWEDILNKNDDWNGFKDPIWIMGGQKEGGCLICSIISLKLFFAVVKSGKAKWGKEWAGYK